MRASIRAAFRREYDKLEQPDREKLVTNTYRSLSAEERKAVLLDLLYERAYVFMASVRSQHEEASDRPNLSRWTAVSDAYQRFIQRPEYVNGEYKFLADCTYDDLLWLTNERENRAADVLAVADQYRTLAQKLEKTKKKFVKDLPPADVEEALS